MERAFVAEVQQLGVQTVGNYSDRLPACVEVAGVLLGGDEAAIEIGGAAARGFQRAQGVKKPVEQ